MSIDEFKESTRGKPPPGLSGALLVLWHDARGDWEAAHGSAQGDPTAGGAWVHAYLHRREGDTGNASYWYRKAGRPDPSCGVEDEWGQIAGALLAEAGTRAPAP